MGREDHLSVATLDLTPPLRKVPLRRLGNGEFRVRLSDYLPEGGNPDRFPMPSEVDIIVATLQAEPSIASVYSACGSRSHPSFGALHVMPSDTEDTQFDRKLDAVVQRAIQALS